MEHESNRLHSNPRSLGRQVTSRAFWPIREAWYQPLLSHDLSYHGAKIQRDASYQSKRSDQSAHRLSSNSTISSTTLEIRVNGLHLPMPTSTKSSQRHRRRFHQLRSPASLQQDPTRRRAGSICSGQNLTLVGWCYVSKHSQTFTLKMLSSSKTLPSQWLWCSQSSQSIPIRRFKLCHPITTTTDHL